jgi:hypothetical protein
MGQARSRPGDGSGRALGAYGVATSQGTAVLVLLSAARWLGADEVIAVNGPDPGSVRMLQQLGQVVVGARRADAMGALQGLVVSGPGRGGGPGGAPCRGNLLGGQLLYGASGERRSGLAATVT